MLSSRLKTLGLLAVCGAGFVLAGGCGSDDGKKAVQSPEAGAAGSDDGGSPSSGGSMSSPGGAAGEPSAGQAGALTGGEGGVAGAGGAAAAGEAGQGGEPPVVNDCQISGNATGLALLTEPTYQGCRGSIVHIGFDVTNSDDTFTCCAVSTSKPAFVESLLGFPNFDGGGDVLMAVPDDAPLGSYALDVTCPGQVSPEGIGIEINDAAPPVVTSVTSEIFPDGTLVVSGQNLDTVTQVMAINPNDGTVAFCNIDEPSTTATSLSCSFNAIAATNAGEAYILDVSNDTCGSALKRPTFIVDPFT